MRAEEKNRREREREREEERSEGEGVGGRGRSGREKEGGKAGGERGREGGREGEGGGRKGIGERDREKREEGRERRERERQRRDGGRGVEVNRYKSKLTSLYYHHTLGMKNTGYRPAGYTRKNSLLRHQTSTSSTAGNSAQDELMRALAKRTSQSEAYSANRPWLK